MATSLGIDPERIYFREEIAGIWGYDFDPSRYDDLAPAQRMPLIEAEEAKMRKWFQRNFIARGLRVFKTAGRTAVHGRNLSEWVLHNSTRCDE